MAGAALLLLPLIKWVAYGYMKTRGGIAVAETVMTGLQIAEFSALRDEIVKYADMQSKLESLTLIVAGGLFSLSTTLPLSTFVYPIIAMFLAARWTDLQVTIDREATYLRNTYEKYGSVPPRWETFSATTNFKGSRALSSVLGPLAIAGLFLVTQALALVWSRLNPTTLNLPAKYGQLKTFLSVSDIVALVITAAFLLAAAVLLDTGLARWRRHRSSMVAALLNRRHRNTPRREA